MESATVWLLTVAFPGSGRLMTVLLLINVVVIVIPVGSI